MRVQLNGRKLNIRWRYDDVQVIISGRPITYPVVQEDGELVRFPLLTPRTSCIASDAETKLDAESVSVNLWHRDVFDKTEARYQSFSKLVRTMFPIVHPINELDEAGKLIRHVPGDPLAIVLQQKALRREMWDAYKKNFPKKLSAKEKALVEKATHASYENQAVPL